jgi:multidrug resistance efflux pump
MAKYVWFALGITAVVAMGVMIDAQSGPPAVHRADQAREFRIFALGRVEGLTSEIELRSQLTGRIVELPIREGQCVEEGEVLLGLDDQQHRYEVALATAEVELARANLAHLVNGAHPQERAEAAAMYRAKVGEFDLAKRAWKRISELKAAEAVSQQKADDQEGQVVVLAAEVDAAKARLEQIEAAARVDEVRMEEARIQAAEARLELAKVELERTRIHAPCRGQVLEVDVETGELTGPESAQPAIVMVDTTRFQVRAFVEEIDAAGVKLGMTATVRTDGLPDREFKGRVVRLSPRMGRKQLWSDRPAERYDTKTREVWIELEEGESLVVGLRVDVMINPRSLASETAAPQSRVSPPPTR